MQIQLLPPGATGGGPNAINNRGAVVGTANFSERDAGFVWQDGQAVELRPASGFLNATVLDNNNRGAIVGISFINGDNPFVATLWPRRGDPVNLNTLIAADDPLQPFVHLSVAKLINDRGVIVATGADSRDAPFSFSTYLLTPQH
jgi:probable HAF family extracellular repeat protein